MELHIHPGQWHRHPGVRASDQLTLGEKCADVMRNRMGSWTFVGCFFVVMIAWAIANSVFWLGGTQSKHGFDPYPYILLNLFLSMLAGVQAAALLIAAKRQDAITSELAVHDNVLLTENTKVTNEVRTAVGQALMNTQLLHRICEKFGIEHEDILEDDAGLAVDTPIVDAGPREQRGLSRAADDGGPSRDDA
jgi:uncharacterized membrane protein